MSSIRHRVMPSPRQSPDLLKVLESILNALPKTTVNPRPAPGPSTVPAPGPAPRPVGDVNSVTNGAARLGGAL